MPAKTCADCQRPLKNPRAVRCKACGARHRQATNPPATRFTPETAAAAAHAKHERDRRNAEIVRALRPARDPRRGRIGKRGRLGY